MSPILNSAQKKYITYIPVITISTPAQNITSDLRLWVSILGTWLYCAANKARVESLVFSLNIFYFNLVRYTYKYIQVIECKRIRTKAGSLCYSSPRNWYSTFVTNTDSTRPVLWRKKRWVWSQSKLVGTLTSGFLNDCFLNR